MLVMLPILLHIYYRSRHRLAYVDYIPGPAFQPSFHHR